MCVHASCCIMSHSQCPHRGTEVSGPPAAAGGAALRRPLRPRPRQARAGSLKPGKKKLRHRMLKQLRSADAPFGLFHKQRRDFCMPVPFCVGISKRSAASSSSRFCSRVLIEFNSVTCVTFDAKTRTRLLSFIFLSFCSFAPLPFLSRGALNVQAHNPAHLSPASVLADCRCLFFSFCTL